MVTAESELARLEADSLEMIQDMYEMGDLTDEEYLDLITPHPGDDEVIALDDCPDIIDLDAVLAEQRAARLRATA